MPSKKKQFVPETKTNPRRDSIIKKIEEAIKEEQRVFILGFTNKKIDILWSDFVSVWESEAILTRVLSALQQQQQQPNQKKR